MAQRLDRLLRAGVGAVAAPGASGIAQAVREIAGPLPAEPGLFEALPGVPRALGEAAVAGFGGAEGAGRLAGRTVQDIVAAREGDREAAKRAAARGLAAGTVAGGLVPGGGALAARAGLGALGGAFAVGAESAVRGGPVLPSAGAGGLLGAVAATVLPPILRSVAPRRGAPVAAVVRPSRRAPLENILDVAETFRPQGMAQATLNRVAVQRGIDPQDLQALIQKSDVTVQDLSMAFVRHGLTADDLKLLRSEIGVDLPKPAPAPALVPQAPVKQRIALAQRIGPERAQAVIQARKLGISRDDRLSAATAVTGRKIKSFKDLTDEEARRVTTHFRDLSDPSKLARELNRTGTGARAVVTRALDRLPQGVGDVLDDAARTHHYLVTAGASYFRRLGAAGNRLADLAEQARANTFMRIAQESDRVKQVGRGFTAKQGEEIGEVMQGAPTSDPRLAAAADELSDLLARYGDEFTEFEIPVMTASTGVTHPFRARPAYFPKIWTEKSIGRWAPPAERAWLRRQFRRLPPAVRAGNVQFAREMADSPGNERDAFKAVALYIDRAAPRAEQARLLGGKDEVAKALIQEIEREHGRKAANQASEVFTAWAYPSGSQPLPAMVRDLSAPFFLTYSGIIQPTQVFLNTVAREGTINTLKGIARFASSREARREVHATGAGLRTALEDIIQTGGVSDKWSHMIGLSQLDRTNRLVSGLASRFRAEDVAREIARGKLTPKNLIDAKRLGLDVSAVSQQRGILTQAQLNEAMLRGSISTQFLADALSTPLAKQAGRGWGQVVFLYRTFLLNQGRFFKDLVKDAKAGHWAPLMRYMATLGTAGVAFGEGMRALRGTPPPDDPFWRVTEDLFYFGSLGLYGDMLNAVGRGREQILATLVGPAVSEAAGVTADVAAAVRGEPEALQRRLLRRTVRRVPVVGEELFEELAP